MNLDSYGLPVQADGDANDQLQRVGMVLTGITLGETMRGIEVANFFEALRKRLQPASGVYSRYTGAPTNNVSADQLIAALAAWVALEEPKQVFLMLARCLSRLGFAQNTKDGLNGTERIKIPDFLLLRGLPLFLRAHWLLYPASLLCDLLLILLAISAIGPVWRDDVGFSKRSPEDVDDNNTILTLFVCAKRLPTPLSKLALKLYLKFRPLNYGCLNYTDRPATAEERARYGVDTVSVHGPMYHPVVGALRWYHRAESGGNPEIAELWRPIIERELNKK